MKEELRNVPFKNYVVLGIVLIVSMLILYYFYMWIEAYNDTKLNKPIMNKYMEVINYNELGAYLVENPNTIIYVSVLENKEIRDFEKQFKKIFKNRKVKKDILYLDVTENMKDEYIRNDLSSVYMINSDVPKILVFDDGIIGDVYNIDVTNYDVNKIKEYINNIKFSNEDNING